MAHAHARSLAKVNKVVSSMDVTHERLRQELGERYHSAVANELTHVRSRQEPSNKQHTGSLPVDVTHAPSRQEPGKIYNTCLSPIDVNRADVYATSAANSNILMLAMSYPKYPNVVWECSPNFSTL